MAHIIKETPVNKTLDLMRRLAAEKRETQRQLRKEFATNADLQRVITELDKRNAEPNA